MIFERFGKHRASIACHRNELRWLTDAEAAVTLNMVGICFQRLGEFDESIRVRLRVAKGKRERDRCWW